MEHNSEADQANSAKAIRRGKIRKKGIARQLEIEARESIISMGLRMMFIIPDETFNDFWKDFWENFNPKHQNDFLTTNVSFEKNNGVFISGYVIGLFMAEKKRDGTHEKYANLRTQLSDLGFE